MVEVVRCLYVIGQAWLFHQFLAVFGQHICMENMVEEIGLWTGMEKVVILIGPHACTVMYLHKIGPHACMVIYLHKIGPRTCMAKYVDKIGPCMVIAMPGMDYLLVDLNTPAIFRGMVRGEVEWEMDSKWACRLSPDRENHSLVK